MTNQSEDQHEARSGTAQRTNGDLVTSRRRFFNDAFRKGVTTKETTLDAIVAGLRSFLRQGKCPEFVDACATTCG
jgi:hypothetical protein